MTVRSADADATKADREPHGMSLVRPVAFALLAILVVYLVYLGGAWAGIHSAVLRQASLVLTGLACAAWAVVAARDAAWRPRTALWPAFAAALLAFSASTLASRNMRISGEYLAWAVVLGALYLLLVRLMANDWFRERLLGLAALLCAITGAWFVVAVASLWVQWWEIVGRVTTPPFRPMFESLTFGNPSAVLTVTVLLLAVAAAFIGVGSRVRAIAVGILAVLTVFAVVVSGSRAGWLAVAAAAALTLLVWFLRGDNLARARGLIGRAPRWWPILIVPVGLAALSTAPAFASRLAAGGEALRATYLATAVRMWSESPVVGTGPGTWVVQRLGYTGVGEQDFYIPHAHNLYVQTLAELGLVGLAAGVVAIVAVGRLLREALRDGDPRRRRFAWAALFTTGYFAVHNVFDFYASMPTALFAFALPIALLDGTASAPGDGRGRQRSAGRSGAIGLAGASALAMSLVALMKSDAVSVEMSSGVSLANEGNWRAAAVALERASTADPDIAVYDLAYGLALAHGGDHTSAAAAFRRATRDDLPEAWLNLAAEEAELGRTAEARHALNAALRLGIQRPGICIAAGHVALALGDEKTAARAFTASIRLAPTLAGDDWWSVDPDRHRLFEGAVETLLREGPANAIVIGAAAGRNDEARSIAESLQSPGRELYLDFLGAWEGNAGATESLIDRARERPIDGPVALAALALGHAGHPDADRFRLWADTINAGVDAHAYAVRVTEPEPGAVPYGTASFYGHYTYRRPAPWDLLVPSLPHLRLE